MAISQRFNFAVGVRVNILTTNGTFTGELIEETGVTTTETTTTTATATTTTTGSFLVVRLTTATAPFSAGQVIRINTNRIVALG